MFFYIVIVLVSGWLTFPLALKLCSEACSSTQEKATVHYICNCTRASSIIYYKRKTEEGNQTIGRKTDKHTHTHAPTHTHTHLCAYFASHCAFFTFFYPRFDHFLLPLCVLTYTIVCPGLCCCQIKLNVFFV